MRSKCLLLGLLVLLFVSYATVPLLASEQGSSDRVTVTVIEQQLQQRFYGRMLAIRLRDKKGLLVYEVNWLGPDQQVAEFRLNARTGELFWMRGINLNKLERKQHEAAVSGR